jgi:hypothetical protein
VRLCDLYSFLACRIADGSLCELIHVYLSVLLIILESKAGAYSAQDPTPSSRLKSRILPADQRMRLLSPARSARL